MSAATTDIRLTTRYDEGDLNSLMAAIHEFGHGFYEAGIDPRLENPALAGDVDEPARVAEPHVGEPRRAQPPVLKHFYPQLQAAYPGQFDDVELEEFYRAINKVEPSLIRIEADEVTHNLHIILRFELEQEILDGQFDLADLPESGTPA